VSIAGYDDTVTKIAYRDPATGKVIGYKADNATVVKNVAGMISSWIGSRDLDLNGVDPALAAAVLPEIDSGMIALRKMRRQIAKLAATVTVDGIPCDWCGRPVLPSTGTRPRLYCSRSCRQRAYEERRAGRLK
jgi:hypothetical protein